MTSLLSSICNQISENLQNGKHRFDINVYKHPCTVWVHDGIATLCRAHLSALVGPRTYKSVEKAANQLRTQVLF